MDGRKGCRKGIAVCLALLMGLSGCGRTEDAGAQMQTLPETLMEGSGVQSADEQAASVQAADGQGESGGSQMRGSGRLQYAENVQPLTGEQERLLLDYRNLYFASLEDFEQEEEIGSFFSNEEQAALADSAIAFQIGLRQMQNADYTLASWSYVLTLNEVTQEEDGSVHILALEDNVQNFSQNPEISSERYGGFHQFELEEVNGSWKISSHMMFDAVYMMLWNEGGWEEAARRYAQAVPEYLERAREGLLAREEDRNREPESVQAQHAYDRQAALVYAEQYVEERNSEWPDYGGRGGNCQNYASQVLFAGNIPMDAYGDAVWKWYSDEVSNEPGAQGRSSSWTGVDQFVQYAASNTGYGLAAETDAPYFEGEPGDLLHMGIDGEWDHTVVIASAVEDEEGNVVDYLVHSNTGNLRSYPASLYGYPEIILTKISGWNEG